MFPSTRHSWMTLILPLSRQLESCYQSSTTYHPMRARAGEWKVS